jgi:hypothetical protein
MQMHCRRGATRVIRKPILAPADRMIFKKFAAWARMNAANSSGMPPTASHRNSRSDP